MIKIKAPKRVKRKLLMMGMGMVEMIRVKLPVMDMGTAMVKIKSQTQRNLLMMDTVMVEKKSIFVVLTLKTI
jgi:hypothetical protein